MKKKFLTLLISVSLLTTTLASCGGKEAIEDADKQVETVETEATEPTIKPSVTGEGVIMELPTDDGIIEIEGEVTEIPDGDVTEIVGEVTTEVVPDDGIDWSVKYDDYFTRDNIMPATPQITVSSFVDDIAMDLIVAATEESTYMAYDFGTVAIEMYLMGDKVYAFTSMEEEDAWYWAPVSLEEEVDAITGMADTPLVDNEDMESCTYREAIVEDGVVYDVLDVTVVDETETTGTAAYFINRETQMIEKCVMEQEGSIAVCFVEEVESIELPAEAAEATEVTMEDILGAMLSVLFLGSGAATE